MRYKEEIPYCEDDATLELGIQRSCGLLVSGSGQGQVG